MKKLPIGIQTFRDIIENNYIYVDKTKHIHQLIESGKGTYFLSRPRRFGKSLLISTLAEIFLGNRELFKGLYIADSDYSWKKHPVIRLDFSKQKAETKEALISYLVGELELNAKKYSITLTKAEYYSQFEELILKLSESGKVVILIDEYDKPIIDWLDRPEQAKEMRSVLKGFFSVLKGNDANIRFLFLTGVSKFSKAGVFSDLNHLNDITLTSKYSSLLGITEEELKNFFYEHIQEFSREGNISEEALIEKIRFWYNGYNFANPAVSVYNPFSTLLLFQNQKFSNYWFESGTPSFLINLMIERNYEVASIPLHLEELLFSSYDVEDLSLTPLLLQTGYLTIKGYDPERMLYTLDYPNFEVKRAFLSFFVKRFRRRELSESVLYQIIDSLQDNDLENCMEVLRQIFSGIEYDLHIPQEKYYQTLFYLVFTMMGLKIQTEVKTNIGRIDAVIESRSVYIFEFKFSGTKEEALAQIKNKKYYEKYINKGKDVFLVGAEFRDRNIGDYAVEKI
ncbi:MAG TPA: AAA family ATPase [Leptospiraceae bacterium]|nr:AAA family ATPase [Leptospiraceae bacterium]HNF12107.1 AAA family ATPase [Leptospiraceae bacterium]HNI97181.1 AAA family ATPase [Leptospiraceae bacterium]HNM02119.1 AAA family ATPase [Leptospiraceae bacterium]HNN02252.1 AAA family ATPase [Leptospiraceae bacterium]